MADECLTLPEMVFDVLCRKLGVSIVRAVLLRGAEEVATGHRGVVLSNQEEDYGIAVGEEGVRFHFCGFGPFAMETSQAEHIISGL